MPQLAKEMSEPFPPMTIKSLPAVAMMWMTPRAVNNRRFQNHKVKVVVDPPMPDHDGIEFGGIALGIKGVGVLNPVHWHRQPRIDQISPPAVTVRSPASSMARE